MEQPKTIKEILAKGGTRLADLRARSEARCIVLERVCAAVPDAMAASIVSAGIEGGLLTVGVTSAAWASRLRYLGDTLRTEVGRTTGVEIERVRVRVVPPP